MCIRDRLKDVVQDEDIQKSGEAIMHPTNSAIIPMQEQEPEQEQEDDGPSYPAGPSSNVASLEPQSMYPTRPPSLAPDKKRDSMTNIASIARSKALRSGSLLKPGGKG